MTRASEKVEKQDIIWLFVLFLLFVCLIVVIVIVVSFIKIHGYIHPLTKDKSNTLLLR